MTAKKKTTVKKKPAKEYVRKGVRLSKKIHEELIDAIEAFEDDYDAWKPYVYMLGENKHRVVKAMIKIDEANAGGCGEMPALDKKSLAKAYIQLSKKGLIPCGYARVCHEFEFGGFWAGDSGNDIYKNVDYILSLDCYSIVAESCKKGPRAIDGSNKLRTLFVEIMEK